MIPDKKVIVFDIDGTLTPSKSPITLEMAKLVQELMKQKMVVAISGASIKQFQTQFLPLLLNDESILPFIQNLKLLPTSGSQRFEYDKEKNEWVMTDKEPLGENIKTTAKKLLQEIINSEKYEIPPDPAGDLVEDRDTQITFSGRGQLASVEEKTKWDPDRKKREKIKTVLEPELPDASILINAYSSIDILPKGFNKAVGLTRFLTNLGLDKSDALFVGDGLFPSGNDYSLYEAGFDTIAVKGPEETAQVIKKWIG
ncbi:MAG: HAD-IIB family hydrolase [Candidatus Paceibacterota bacterium]